MAFPLTADEIDAVAARAKGIEPYEIATVFSRKAAEEGLPSLSAEGWGLLAFVMHLPFRPGNAARPYGDPRGGTSFENLTVEQASELGTIGPTINSLEVRARLADVAWARNRGDPRLARHAVAAYLAAARAVEDPENWVGTVERVERAARLSRSLGADDESFAPVSAYLQELSDRYRGDDPLFLTGNVIELLLELGLGDLPKLIEYASRAASRASVAGRFELCRYYLDLVAKLYGRQGDTQARNATLREVAKSFEVEAEQREVRGENLAAGVLLNQAIEAHRRIPGGATYVEALRPRLQRVERAAVGQFRKVENKFDVCEFAAAARKVVAGKSKKDAVLHLAHVHRIGSAVQTRKLALEMASRFPLQNFMGAAIVDDEGRVIARRPPLMPGENGDEQEEAIFARMVEQAALQRQAAVPAVILPALLQVTFEHAILWNDMVGLVSHSPFVPEGRIRIFADGLYAGFNQDFLIAAHLLIPQIENSLRHLMHVRDMITTRVDKNGIQRQIDLNELVVDPRAAEVVSPDVLFEVRCLCTDNRGPNLRNQLAHGMLEEGAFFSVEALYAWWLVLALCIFGPAVQPNTEAAGSLNDQ